MIQRHRSGLQGSRPLSKIDIDSAHFCNAFLLDDKHPCQMFLDSKFLFRCNIVAPIEGSLGWDASRCQETTAQAKALD